MSGNPNQDVSIEEAFKPVIQSESQSESSSPKKETHQNEELDKQIEIIKELRKLMEKCSPIRDLTICVGDKVSVKVGRYWYVGEVLHVSKLSLVLLNNNREVALAIGKISTIAILEDGEYGKRWKELKGSRIWITSD